MSGQGVNYEMCQMTKLKDFSSGGVLHLVVNNQIGFTAEATSGRTGRYATDLFKAFEAPIWRASTPEGVVRAARMAAAAPTSQSWMALEPCLRHGRA